MPFRWRGWPGTWCPARPQPLGAGCQPGPLPFGTGAM